MATPMASSSMLTMLDFFAPGFAQTTSRTEEGLLATIEMHLGTTDDMT